MYKIFHENKTLIFPKIDGDLLKFDATLQESDRYEADILCDFLQEWLADRDQTDAFIHEVGENAVAEALKQTFKMAPAAGGVVVKDGKFVSIVRHGIPDLPKGHIEKGENPEQAALREVEEETGIGKLQIVKSLPSTWHCYFEHEEWKLKRTYWYLMESEESNQLSVLFPFGFFYWYFMEREETIQPKPQTEEGITEIKLIGNEGIEDFLKNTFRSISEILAKDLRQVVAK